MWTDAAIICVLLYGVLIGAIGGASLAMAWVIYKYSKTKETTKKEVNNYGKGE